MLDDPGDEPPDGATPAERAKWQRDRERFLTEGFRSLPDRAAENLPDPTDKRLKQLAASDRRFLEMHNPMTEALKLALLRPAADVLHSAEQVRRFAVAQQGGDAGPHQAPRKSSILAIADAIVAKGILGDTNAITQIADRIEGKPGLRVGDEGENSPEQRKQAAAIAERVTRALTQARLEKSKPIDVEVVDVTPTKE